MHHRIYIYLFLFIVLIFDFFVFGVFTYLFHYITLFLVELYHCTCLGYIKRYRGERCNYYLAGVALYVTSFKLANICLPINILAATGNIYIHLNKKKGKRYDHKFTY